MSETLGKLLSAQRLKMGLTVEEVAARTRINAKFIRAAEADRFDQFPGAVFVRGFLRSYAALLELPAEDVIARYEALDIKEKDHSPKLISMPLHERPGLSGFSAVLLFLFTVAAGLWLFFYINREKPVSFTPVSRAARESLPAPQPETRSVEKSPAPAGDKPAQAAPAPVKEAKPEPAVPAAKPAPAAPAAPAPETALKPAEEQESLPPDAAPAQAAIEGISDTSRPYSLTVSAASDTWIRAVVDENVTREIILREGHTVTWWAEKGYKISIGNVAGTKLYLNGEQVPLEQPASNVIMNLTLPRQAAASGEGNIAGE